MTSGATPTVPCFAMLTVAKIGGGDRARQLYYEQEVASSHPGYYTGQETPAGELGGDAYAEPPGAWMGEGADKLGLGEVRVELNALRAMWAGSNPSDAGALAEHACSVSAFDLLFAAPKSVSLAHAMADGETREAIASAHGEAVREGLGYLERNAALVRRRVEGELVAQPADGLLVAAFEQHWNRESDPHLHTHAVVANMAPGPDGRWTALHGGAIYRHAKTAGHVYQAALRRELSERLGVEWGSVRNGQAEIVGVPRGVLEHFSRRRAAILENVAQSLESPAAGGAEARTYAQRRTRRAKEHHDPGELVADARAQAGELGFDREAFDRVIGRPRTPPELTRGELVELGRLMAGPEGLTAQANLFTRCEVIEALATAHPDGASAQRLEKLADMYLASRNVVAVDRDPAATLKGPRYTSADLLIVERRVLERAREGRGASVAAASEPAVQSAINGCRQISAEQAEMVRAFCLGGDRLMVGVGRAGTGKTFTAAVMADAYEQSGVAVFGAAVAKRAARGLESETGIPSRTVASLLSEYERWGAWPREMRGGVLFIDEMGMLSTRQMDRLLDAAWEAGMDVRGIGDDAQLPEIGAGGTLRALVDELPSVELCEVRRQREQPVRESLEYLREGRASEWYAGAKERGNVISARSADELRDAAVANYLSDAHEVGFDQVLMLARTHDVRCDLNDRVRDRLREGDRLGERELMIGQRGFAEGDRVVATRNDARLDVENGATGTVRRVREDRGLDVALDDGRKLTLPLEYLQAGHVDHAYALTVYKAQGATVERAHFVGSEDVYREEGYTALSRSRQESRFYIVEHHDRSPIFGQDPGDDRVGHLPRGMGESRAQEFASAVLKRSEEARELGDEQLRERAGELGGRVIEEHRHQERREALERCAQYLDGTRERLAHTEQQIADRGWRGRRDKQLQYLRSVQERAVHASEEAYLEAHQQAQTPPQEAREHEQRLAEATAAKKELERRETQRVREAAEEAMEHPGKHITDLIGERDQAADRETWERAATRLEAYHQTYQPESPELRAPELRASRQERQAFEQVKDSVTRARGDEDWRKLIPQPSLDRAIHRDRGPDLGMDMGP
ncbi:MAG: relaxase domain-containing protein [Actinomycetota bacterium]|nr:relaxase domain-containing protein [Actinomycetota bacterium]